MKKTELSLKAFDPAMWIIILYLLLFFVLFKAAPVILGAILFGWYLSMIINVPTRFLSRFIKYKIALLISSIGMFVIIAFAVYSIFPVLIEEGKKFFPVVGSTARDINVENFFNGDNIDPKLTEWLNSLIGDVGRNISEFGASILNTIIQNIPAVSTSAILFVITAAYFATIMPVLRENLWRLFPKSTRERSIHFFRECYRDIEHYIRGQVILALIVGVMVGIGTSLSGVPYSLFLGFLSGIFDFIPFLGPILVSIPGMLLGFLYGGVPGLIKMLIVFLFANQLESWVLQPRIQGTRMKVNWFAILLAILIAGSIFGLPGVLIGIPFLAFFKRFWVEYVQEGFEKM